MDFFRNLSPKRPGLLLSFWIPLLMPGVLLVADCLLIPQAFMFPLMLLILLCFLAYRLPPWMIGAWGAVYAVVVLTISFLPLQETQTLPALRPYVRTVYFLVSGTIITFLAINRGRVEQSRAAIFTVLSDLPVAVIISDISGNILLMNAAASRLLTLSPTLTNGLSYFSTFMNPDNQGRHIAEYMNYFQAGRTETISTNLCTRGEPQLNLEVTITIATFHTERYAVTVVRKSEAVAPAVASASV